MTGPSPVAVDSHTRVGPAPQQPSGSALCTANMLMSANSTRVVVSRTHPCRKLSCKISSRVGAPADQMTCVCQAPRQSEFACCKAAMRPAQSRHCRQASVRRHQVRGLLTMSSASGYALTCGTRALSRDARCACSGAASLGRPPISEGDACPTFIDESSGEIMEVFAAQSLCFTLMACGCG